MGQTYKILHIFSGFGGGISSVIWNLVKNADNQKITQSIMCFSMKNGEMMVNDVIKNGGQAFIMPRLHSDGIVAIYKYVNTIIRPDQFDIIHCHIDGAIALFFKFIANKAGIRHFIIHAHQSADKYGNQDAQTFRVVIRQLLTNIAADERFSCGIQAGEYVFGKRNSKKMFVINNCIDREKYIDLYDNKIDYRKRLCQDLDIDEKKMLIGHVGRFDYPKNHEFLIDIANELRNLNHNFAMILVGDGSLIETIKEKTNRLGLRDYVFFLGRRYDVPQLMRAFDVVLLPSLSEGFPTVALEAQASGTYILISDRVTHDADLKIGLTDYLPVSDSIMWAKKIFTRKKSQKAMINIVNNAFTEKRYWSKQVGEDYTNKILEIMKEG